MKLATTTADFWKYISSVEEQITKIHEAGFCYIDLNLYRENTMDSLYMQDNWKDYVNGLKKHAESLGMEFVQAHAPDTNPICKDEKWEMQLKTTLRSIEVCGLLGIPNIVVHSGWADGVSKEEYFEQNRDYYRLLLPTAEENGVNVLIENSMHANMGEKYFFFTGAEMREFIDYVNHPRLRACWDTGHANAEGDQYSHIMELGDYLCALHVQDNTGTSDMHIMPYCGTLNPDDLMHALIDSGYQGVFTFEADNTLHLAHGWPIGRREFKKDNRAANPTIKIQEAAEKLLYEIGVHILSSYDCFEE